jgi:hypothetical protein
MATTPPQTFQWGPGGRAMTPREVAESRAVAQALAGQRSKVAQNPWEGIAQVANAWSERQWREQAAAAEEAGTAEAAGLFGGLTSSSPQADIIAALNTPWASDTQSSVARALLGEQLEANDPYKKLQLAQAQLDYEQDLAGDADGGYFGSTLPYENADGSLGYIQLSKGGLPELPEGARWLEPTSTVNTGTAQTVIGRNTGAVQGAIPIDNLGAESAKTVGTGLGNISVEVINAGRSARSNNAKLDILDQTLSAAPQGMQGALVQAAGTFGIPMEGLDDVQASQAIINQLVPLQRLPGSGTMSDADLALFKQSLPAIINQPGGNKKIIKTLRAINDYVEKAGDIEWRLVSGKIDQATADKEYGELSSPLENFSATESGNQDAVVPKKYPNVTIRVIE